MQSVGACRARVFTPDERRILEILSDGKFHSGVQLGEFIGKTRASVLHNIKTLSEHGISFNRVVGRGYQLQHVPCFYDADLLKRRPGLTYFDSVESTNTYLLGKPESPEGSVVVAGFQEGGKGRRGREFVSRFGEQVMFSYACRFNEPAEIAGLSIVAGISVVKVLRAAGQRNLGLKWPNDIYVDGKKAGGILVETNCGAGGVYAVIGIGINVAKDFLFSSDMARVNREISVAEAVGNDGSGRSRFLLNLCEQLDRDLEEYRKCGLGSFVSEFNECDVYRGHEVVLINDNVHLCGISDGISSSGALVIYDDEGVRREIFAGDVSLRPVAGTAGLQYT